MIEELQDAISKEIFFLKQQARSKGKKHMYFVDLFSTVGIEYINNTCEMRSFDIDSILPEQRKENNE